ncbi:Ger(x)C family spore germination protein [Rossellomorea sp. RS05]|uniref:Ger(x)C family spore germination protein n=1 Tax=Rossellomorea sp. RS05 TaxID=3149166 RepID=UPI003221CC66
MKKLWILFFSFVLLTGCSGLKNIQDLSYIVAIGVDYDEEEEEFTIYLQGLNFSNVAKQEGTRSSEPIPNLIGVSKGKTINLAVGKLYKKSKPTLFYGHIKSVVVTESVLQHTFDDVLEVFGRNRSLRPNMLFFSTNEKLDEVFAAKGLYDYPPIYTVLLTEENHESLTEEIGGTSLMRFRREYNEPMGAAMLPIISIDRQAWKGDDMNASLLISGFNLFQHGSYKGKVTEKDAIFTNWLNISKSKINYDVYMDGELVAVFYMTAGNLKKSFHGKGKDPVFDLTLNVQAELVEIIKSTSYDGLKEALETSIEKDIKDLYTFGIGKETDLLHIGDGYYRRHPEQYKKLKDHYAFFLNANSLQATNVDVTITNFNTYNYEKEKKFD